MPATDVPAVTSATTTESVAATGDVFKQLVSRIEIFSLIFNGLLNTTLKHEHKIMKRSSPQQPFRRRWETSR
ncbi:hypothetical protein GE061_010017 [Apolygus lucorum]|uniref:Uncharacterized protein n=1 Tax=Apolygus lucorum TaxID=248454 RepID=A0A8S9Y600_APOLU|nr:hypothetical protein GE061_010017 [Apolygus lucorum]